MDSTKPTPDGPATPGFGIARDLRQLKTHSAASVAELREFLAQMRGRRPQEVLGLVAGSHLMRSVAVATVGAVLILAVGSVVPWWLNRLSADSASAAKPGHRPPRPPRRRRRPRQPEPRPAEPPAPAPAADATPSPADAEKAIKVMGLGDTKVADPKNESVGEKSRQPPGQDGVALAYARSSPLPDVVQNGGQRNRNIEIAADTACQKPRADAPCSELRSEPSPAARPWVVAAGDGRVHRLLGGGDCGGRRAGLERRALLARGLRPGRAVLHRLGLGRSGRSNASPSGATRAASGRAARRAASGTPWIRRPGTTDGTTGS